MRTRSPERSTVVLRKNSVEGTGPPILKVYTFAKSGSGDPQISTCRDYSTPRDRGVKLPHRQPNPPPYKSFHDGREPCVPVRIGREDKNEGRSRMSHCGSVVHPDSTDQ